MDIDEIFDMKYMEHIYHLHSLIKEYCEETGIPIDTITHADSLAEFIKNNTNLIDIVEEGIKKEENKELVQEDKNDEEFNVNLY